MMTEAKEAAIRAANENDVLVEFRPVWRIEPRPFDPQLIELCAAAVRETTGDAPRLPSGPLHDAAEMVPHMPVVMMFAYSSRGLSHCKEEDTPEPYLAKTIDAFQLLVDKTISSLGV
jgi:N-carbamoyl-L-amino-acid hydrolase